jgi:tRNA(Ile)-lysidine synthase
MRPNPRDASLEHFAGASLALRTLGATKPFLVAVSGGPDSVALLHYMERHRAAAGLPRGRIVAAHVNHRLRGAESDADAEFVRGLAARCDVSYVEARLAPLPAASEEAMRHARYDALRDLARDAGADRVTTAHTADDQAETVLLRLLRGAGLRGLSGMPAQGRVRGVRVVRPFLGVSRAQVLEYLTRHALRYREDSSNGSLAPSRNFVRLELMPRIRERLNPSAREAITRAAAILRETDAYMAAEAERRLPEVMRREDGGKISLDAGRMLHYPKPLNSYLFRFAVQELNGDIRDLSTAHIDALLSLVTTPSSRSADLPGGTRARRERGLVVLERGNLATGRRKSASKA